MNISIIDTSTIVAIIQSTPKPTIDPTNFVLFNLYPIVRIKFIFRLVSKHDISKAN